MKYLLALALVAIATTPAAAQNVDALAQRLKNGDGKAALELARLGAKAVPALREVLKANNDKASGHAAYALGVIGPPAKDAVAELVEALSTGEDALKAQAALALGNIGPEAGPALVKKLGAGDEKTSVHAARALAGIKAPVQGAVAPLVKGLKSTQDAQTQVTYIDALARQGTAAAVAVPLLVDLAETGKTPRAPIVMALGQIGPGAKDAIPFLVEQVRKKDNGPVTLHAVQALGQIGVRSADVSAALLDLMKEETQPRMILLESLSKAGAVTKENLPALSQGMRDKDSIVRLYSARLVGSVDANDLSVVSVLIEALQDKDIRVRKLAAEVLQGVQPRDEAVFETLQGVASRDPDATVRQAATAALTKFKKK